MGMPPQIAVSIDQIGGAIKASIGPAASLERGPLNVPDALGKRLAVRLTSDMKGHFDRGAGPDGVAWAPIKPRPQGGDKPLLNTGKLRASITGQAEPHGASAGTNAIQANLMNAGGTIRPVRAKRLSIPLTREAVRAGSPLKFPRELFIMRTKNGHLLLVELPQKTKTGKAKKQKRNENETALAAKFSTGNTMVPQYVLVNSVTIPARRFNGFTKEAIDDCLEMARRFVFGENTR